VTVTQEILTGCKKCVNMISVALNKAKVV